MTARATATRATATRATATRATATLLPALVLSLATAPLAAADAPPADQQIAAATQAAPEDRRAGAGVLGYDTTGKLVELRAGANDLICLADDPADAAFSAACYHESLEPYMARGRELSAQGLSEQERNKIRWQEVEDGKLALPREPRTLYVLSGTGYDASKNEVQGAYLRWVIYTPYATTESTGLTAQPTAGAPWIMYPGTAGAHVMITPPRPKP